MQPAILPRACIAAAVVTALQATAQASEKKSAPADLPGVMVPEPIVKPLAEPILPAKPNANGFVRMGDWDVRVSGSVSVDISAGRLNVLPR